MKKTLLLTTMLVGLAASAIVRADTFSFESGLYTDSNPLGSSDNPFGFGSLPSGNSSISVLDHHFASGQSNAAFDDVFTFSLASEATVTFTVANGQNTDFTQGTFHLFINNGPGTPSIADDSGTPDIVTMDLPAGSYGLIVQGVMPPDPPNFTSYQNETYTGTVSVVPEPQSFALFLLAGGIFLLHRRHRECRTVL